MVALMSGGLHVIELGLNWGINYFSRGDRFRQELESVAGGALHTTFDPNVEIEGPSLIPPGVVCTWIASVDGGTEPFTYEWSGLVTETTFVGWQTIEVHGSGWLNVKVTDSGFRMDQTSFFITVDSSAPAPPGCTE